jgi:hypothetical protein
METERRKKKREIEGERDREVEAHLLFEVPDSVVVGAGEDVRDPVGDRIGLEVVHHVRPVALDKETERGRGRGRERDRESKRKTTHTHTQAHGKKDTSTHRSRIQSI